MAEGEPYVDVETPPRSPRPARPWLAAVLSLVWAGAGQLYCARPWRAVGTWAVVTVAGVAAVAATLYAPSAADMGVAIGAYFAVYAATIVDAWRLARRSTGAHRPARKVLALVLIGYAVAQFAAGTLSTDFAHERFAEGFRIPSGSMDPTVLSGDWIWVAPRRGREIRRDALVAYETSQGKYLKRAAGLAGDTLSMHDRRLFRNGAPVIESYAHYQNDRAEASDDFLWQRRYLVAGHDTAAYRPTRATWGPIVVPDGQLFMLGDNRDNSLDSRYDGFVAADAVKGFPLRVYFSYDPDAGVRWTRVGHRFD